MKTAVATLVFCIATVAVSHPAQAQTREDVSVLGINDVGGVNDVLAGVITRHLRVAVNRVRDWHLLPVAVGLNQMGIIAVCPAEYPNTACLARIAEQLHVRHVVSGVISQGAERNGVHDVVLDLFWYDVEAAAIVGQYHFETHPDEAAATIPPRIRDWLDQMGVPAADPASGGNALLIPAISLIGAAAVSLAVTIGSWVRISDIQRDPAYQSYRERVPPGTSNVCTEANAGNGWTFDEAAVRKLCSEAATFEVLQWVFLAASAAFAGVGSTLLLLDTGAERAPLTVAPSVGPDHAAFTLTARF